MQRTSEHLILAGAIFINQKEEKLIIYDIEIKKAILGRKEQPIEGIEYCSGWRDHENMGISCICVYDYRQDRYRAFMEDNFAEFQALACDHETIVGFNNIGFDNQVIRANGLFTIKSGWWYFHRSQTDRSGDLIDIDAKSYDLLREIWAGLGLGPEFRFPTHAGYGLDAICHTNFGHGKTGHGAVAPVDYQQGRIGNLIDYCLADVWLTKKLLDLVIEKGEVVSPKTGEVIPVRPPV